MVDYNPQFLALLKSAVTIPVYPEMALTADAALPCVSYQEVNNYISGDSREIQHTVVSFLVKVYAQKLSDAYSYRSAIDTKLHAASWQRISSTPLIDSTGTYIQIISTYEAEFTEKE